MTNVGRRLFLFRSRLVQIAVVGLVSLALAYGYLALEVETLVQGAARACRLCAHEAASTGEDPEHCTSDEVWPVARLVPWASEDRAAARESCEQAVRNQGLINAVHLRPNAAGRDAWLSRSENPDRYRRYEVGAFESLSEDLDGIEEREDWLFTLYAAMHLRSLDTIKRIAQHEVPRGWDVLGRRGAWLCLLGEEEAGRRHLQEFEAFARNSPPDYFRHPELAPLALYACGGEPEHVYDMVRSEYQVLRLSRDEVSIADVLATPGLPAGARRHAIARWIVQTELTALPLEEVLAVVRGGADPLVTPCRVGNLLDERLPVPPDLALRAADRLRQWLDARHEPLAALQATLPPRWIPAVRRSEAPTSVMPDLLGYLARLETHLRLDAALGHLGHGEMRAAREALVAARALTPGACPEAGVLLDARLAARAEMEPGAQAWAALSADDDAAAFEATDSAALFAWQHTLLGVRLGRPPPTDDPDAGWTDMWWQGLSAGDLVALRGRILSERRYPSMRRTNRSAPEVAARMSLFRRAAEGYDEEVLLRPAFAAEVHRGGLWARGHAAREQGRDEQADAWEAWFREIADLASTPTRALLLAVALDEAWATGWAYDRPEPRPEAAAVPEAAPWDGVQLDGFGCQGAWALVPGHLPAGDDAELALRALERDERAAQARASTYVVQLPAEVVSTSVGRVTVAADAAFVCEGAPSEATREATLLDWDALGPEDELMADGFWRERFLLEPGEMLFGLTRGRLERRGDVVFWRAPQFRHVFHRAPPAAQELTLQLAVRVRDVRHDAGAGPWIMCDVLDARLLDPEGAPLD